jgi:hypothetical protein
VALRCAWEVLPAVPRSTQARAQPSMGQPMTAHQRTASSLLHLAILFMLSMLCVACLMAALWACGTRQWQSGSTGASLDACHSATGVQCILHLVVGCSLPVQRCTTVQEHA